MTVRCPETLKEYEHYKGKEGLVVVKYGAEWCGPCKRLKPLLKKLAKEHPHVYFLDVDIDTEVGDHEDTGNVRTIPHCKFFIDGKMKREIIGTDKERLVRYVERYSASTAPKSGSEK